MNQTIHRPLALAIAMLTSVAIASAVCEALVRALSLAPSLEASSGYDRDSLAGYRPRPLSEAKVATDEFAYIRRHNSLGFRDVEHSVAKPPGVYRILGLGDSFTYGVGVDVESTYLHRLEAMLNGRSGVHPRVEIIRWGVPGFFPEPERILLERYGMHYAPDLLLVAFLPNDIVDTHKGMGALIADEEGYLVTREAQRLGRRARWLARHSHLARLVLSRYLQSRITAVSREQGDELYVNGGFHEGDWREVESEYARMLAVAAAGRARMALIHIPQRGPWEQRHAYPAARLSRLSEKHGALFVDVLPAMAAAASQRMLYYPVDGHCTAAGHEIIAQTLFTALTATGNVP